VKAEAVAPVPFTAPPKTRRTVAFVTFTGLQAVGSWPAICESMIRWLEAAGHRVIRVKPVGTNNPLFWKAIQGIYRMAGMRFQSVRQEQIIKGLGASVNEQLHHERPDLILCSSSLPIPFLEKDCPIAFWTDATFKGMLGFYPEFSQMSSITIRNGMYFENLALQKADLAIYSSEWAARSAINDHGADPSKVHVIPFGPNLDLPPSKDVVLDRLSTLDRRSCHSIFIGYDWERKNGPLLMEIHQELLQRGIPSRVTIIGCEPNIDRNIPGVTILGMIDKKDPVQEISFRKALTAAHFLVLPSKAECFGLVYAEASAYGIPSIAFDVGGVADAVRNGRNGQLFPIDASASMIADHIQKIWSDPEGYRELALSSRAEYEQRLNWPLSIEKLMALVEQHQMIRQ
jgi:glycosyltransferase involved in cell wall biosynthesis